MALRRDPVTDSWMFPFGDGWRTLSDPLGLPTARQLLKLNRLGLLGLRAAPDEPVSKLDAALAIDRARRERAA